MKRFRKSKTAVGFNKVNVDKMFSISGGSLTGWGINHIGNQHFGNYRTVNEQVKTGYVRQSVYQESNGRYRMMNVPQYRTESVRYWCFDGQYLNLAGVDKVRVY